MTTWRWAGVVVFWMAMAGPPQAIAAEPAAESESSPAGAPPSPDAPPPVDLDRLLRLPDTYEAQSERRGGATADEWRTRFRKARVDVEDAKRALAEKKQEMERMAGDSSNYQVAAPGAQTSEASPVSFKLRTEIRRRREEVERSERALRQLGIEANLANVPPEWRN